MKKENITHVEYDKGKDLADKHWVYVGGLCEKMYKDAFVHGYKHGKADNE